MFTAKITFKSGNILELYIETDTAEKAQVITEEYLQRKGFKPHISIEII